MRIDDLKRATGATLLVVLAAGSVAAQQSEQVWITLGADAHATLVQSAEVAFAETSLASIESAGDVVLTRVDASDLDAVSRHIHDVHRRCGGYLVHDSRAAAAAHLAALGRRQLRGTPDYVIDQPALVAALSAELDEANIHSVIESLSTDFPNRYYIHPSGVAAASWIRDLWAGYAASRPEVTVELVAHSGFPQPSVILSIPGSTRPDEVVIVGGHLDSTASGRSNPNFSAPGADDDASGIAVISEVARVLLSQGLVPQRSIHFMAYAAEETGLRGSSAIASDYVNRGVDVFSMLQLDMTAYQGSTVDMSLINDFTRPALTDFLADLLDAYMPDLTYGTSNCGYGCSDHAAWYFQGYPSAFVFEAHFGQHNSALHSTADTLATLGDSAAHAFKFARLATAYLVEASVDDALALTPLFTNGFETGDTSEWTQTIIE